MLSPRSFSELWKRRNSETLFTKVFRIKNTHTPSNHIKYASQNEASARGEQSPVMERLES